MLVDNYENEHFPIGFPDPMEAIKFRMEQLGYNQSDLAKVIGLKSKFCSAFLKHGVHKVFTQRAQRRLCALCVSFLCGLYA
jgi:antitoxin component HigA of HigAB toxin-antitoxin module